MGSGGSVIGLFLLAALALASPVRALPGSPLTLTFGLYQTDKPTVLHEMFMPVLRQLQTDLGRRLGRPVEIRLKIHRSYNEGIEALVAGRVHFVRFGPAPYITAKERNPHIKLIAMEHIDGKMRYQGMFFVAKDSAIGSLGDLRGRSFAFGDKNSTTSRYLPQAELVKAGIQAQDLRRHAYLGRHDLVAKAVELGDYDAGSVKEVTYERANRHGALRVLASFESVTKPWVARAGLKGDVFRALQESLLALTDPMALEKLEVSGFMSTSDADYQFVRNGMEMARRFGG